LAPEAREYFLSQQRQLSSLAQQLHRLQVTMRDQQQDHQPMQQQQQQQHNNNRGSCPCRRPPLPPVRCRPAIRRRRPGVLHGHSKQCCRHRRPRTVEQSPWWRLARTRAYSGGRRSCRRPRLPPPPP
ncbi:unnamed protein product, partial [Ectocarpus sp. 12 AP-2014]